MINLEFSMLVVVPTICINIINPNIPENNLNLVFRSSGLSCILNRILVSFLLFKFPKRFGNFYQEVGTQKNENTFSQQVMNFY